MNFSPLRTASLWSQAGGVLPARIRAQSATQVLPTSEGSSTLAPSTRPLPDVLTRHPPPWFHPPSSCCVLMRYSSPRLTDPLIGLGLTAVRISTLASVTLTGTAASFSAGAAGAGVAAGAAGGVSAGLGPSARR